MQMRPGQYPAVDTAVTLPMTAKPNAGRPFVDEFPGTTDEYNQAGNLRLSMAYTKDLGWLGRHQLAGLYERDWTWAKTRSSGRPSWTSLQHDNPTNGANSLRFRTYLNLSGPPDLSAREIGAFHCRTPGSIRSWENINVTQVTDATTGRKMGVKWISNAVPGDNRFR